MKQAEHPPATAGANSAAEYSLALIDQLARIDRTCSKEEMDELVYRLLSLIGETMQSDRVFLFERLEGTAEAYCNTFEWCASGVAPQIDNLTEIVPADMPYWLKVFGRGETIVIPNIEDVKTLMPSEYELLKAQSIRSEIAVPVFLPRQPERLFRPRQPAAGDDGRPAPIACLCRRAPRQRAGEPAHADAAGRKAEVARAEFAGREA